MRGSRSDAKASARFREGGIYHVYNRFARGAEVFRGADDADRFLDLLKQVARRDGLTVFAWVLMSNHYHVALRSGPVSLSRTFGHVQARFSPRFNRRNRSTGPLWQSRYKAKLVEDPACLEQLVAYIHLNRSRRVSSMIRLDIRCPVIASF